MNKTSRHDRNGLALKMTRKSDPTQVRVCIVSLGCPKNLVDAEVIAGQLLSDDMQIVSNPTDAHAVIVNTCAFIDTAKEEGIDVVLQFAAARDKTRPAQALVVAGCLPQRYGESLAKAISEVDAFMGIDQIPKVGEIVRGAVERRQAKISSDKSKSLTATEANVGSVFASRSEHPIGSLPLVDVSRCPTYILGHTTPRLRLTPRHYAYVKIADGCNNRCSYCTIPFIRGKYRSRPLADIIAEAKALLADGARELNLISQDTAYYGCDLSQPRTRRSCDKLNQSEAVTICTLLRELDSLPGRFWIRLLYTHPAHWTDELIRTIAECRKIVRYIDIPLQHINDLMLERMGRRVSRQEIVELLGRIRRGIPGVAIRTSFIVGFPGETEEQFNELLGFIRAMRFERLGVFTYSREEGTAAAKLTGHVPTALKRRRAEILMREQRQIARQAAESYVGRVIKVLVDSAANADQLPVEKVTSFEHGALRCNELVKIENLRAEIRNAFLARSEADAPEIDGVVFVRASKRPLPIGEFVWVKVVGHTDYDLLAEPV